MGFQLLKRINTFLITAVIVVLFGITYYMDTHEGRNPWSEGEIFNQIETPRYTRGKVPENFARYSKYNNNRIYSRAASNTIKYSSRGHYNDGANFPPQTIYVRELHRDISRHWGEFNNATKDIASNNVNIRIVIGRDGEILSSYIEKPSTSRQYDKEALRFVRGQAPFKELPQEYNEPSLNVSLTFGKNTFGTSLF